MLDRLWSLASVGAKPGKTDEPAGAGRLSSPALPQMPSGPALSCAKCPPLTHDAGSPAVILKLSRRYCAPRATFTGDGRPISTDFARFKPATISWRSRRPAKTDSLLGIPGWSAAPAPPRIPPTPGAHRVSRQGPSDRVFGCSKL